MEIEVEVLIQQLNEKIINLRNLKHSFKLPKNTSNIAIASLDKNKIIIATVDDYKKQVLFFSVEFNFENGEIK